MQQLDESGAIDVGGLLTIDVSSELRKLSQAQFQGPWQLPAEIVRRSLRSGALEVHVSTARHGVRIRDDGAGYPLEHLEWTAALLDPRRSNEDRHAALTALESSGELVLLALAGLEAPSLRIETVHDGMRAVLELAPGRSPWIECAPGIAGQFTQLELRSPALERRQVVHWLRSAARFAPGVVTVDGTPIQTGFAGVLAEGALEAPLRGRIAVVREGESAQVWLLEHGLVTGHITVPEAPNLEVAVELGSDATDLSAARLREAVQPHIPRIVEQGVRLLVRLGQRGPMSEALRARVARLVLQAARKGLLRDEIVAVPAFRVVGSRGYRQIDLATLQKIARRGGGRPVLVALYPSQKPERFALGDTPVLVADASERSRLAELLDVRFRPPDPRDTSGSLWLAWRRSLDWTERAARDVGSWIRHPVRAPAIDDTRLTPVEYEFLTHVRKHLAQDPRLEITGARICDGDGPIRRTSKRPRELLLPRGNAVVRAAVAAVRHDPAWVYPVVLALLEGQGLPPATSRATWLQRVIGSY